MTKPFQSRADGYVRWLRERVGHRLIYLVYTTTLVFDEAGRVLVQRRYDFDWLGLPGGALEVGEDLRTCAAREVREETGLEVEVERVVGVFSHPDFNLHYPNGDDVQQWSVCVTARPTGGALHADGGETLAVDWMPVADVLPQIPPAYRAMLRAALGSPRDAVLEPVYARAPLTPHFPLLRQVVGHAPIILPGAMGFIPDERGRVLMVRRADNALWHLPGGFADLGETTTGTLVREVYEETGLEIEPVRAVGVYSEPDLMMRRLENGDVVHGVGIACACRITGGALRPDGREVTEAAFWQIEDLLAAPQTVTPNSLQFLRDFQQPEGWPFLR